MILLALLALLTAAPPASDAAWLSNGNPIGVLYPEQVHPHAASDGRGGAFIATTQAFGSRLQHLMRDGDIAPNWSQTGLAIPPSGEPTGPARVQQGAVLNDGDGAYVALFTGDCGQSCSFDPGHLVLQRLTSEGTPARGWSNAGVPLEQALVDVNAALRMKLAPDGRRGVLAAWDHALRGTPNAPRLVAAQRVSPEGAVLWGAGGVVCVQDDLIFGPPALVPDGECGALVFWAVGDTANGTRTTSVRGQHVSAAGRLLWPREGLVVARSSVASLGPIVATSDGDGGAVLGWERVVRANPVGRALLVTRVSGRGTLAWSGERALCTAPGIRGGLELVATREGGAVAAWLDGRALPVRVFAQRVARSGRMLWRPDGQPVSTGAENVAQFGLASDGGEGAFVGWGESSHGGRLLAVHLDHAGVPQRGWAAEGTAVFAAPSTPGTGPPIDELNLVELPNGHAMLAWTAPMLAPDHVSLLDESFAMLLRPDGPAASPPGTTRPSVLAEPDAQPQAAPATAAFALHGARPNPSVSGAMVRFALPDASPATLEVFDLAGRRVWSREVGGQGAGEHAVRLRDGAWSPPGIYLVRLAQGQSIATSRVVITR